MKVNKRASIFLYILILVSISLVLGLVVFNNSITLTNNLNIGKNSEEVFNNLSKKAELAIDTVRKYNSNGGGLSDTVSCPTDVTMSGSTASGTNISTSIVNNYGSIYCSGNYNGNEFRIYFNDAKTDFAKAYYKGDLIDLQYDPASSTATEGTTNIGPITTVAGTSDYYGNSLERAADDDLNTRYISDRYSNYKSNLVFTFPTSKNISRIILNKQYRNVWYYTNRIKVFFYDDSNTLIDSTIISGVKKKTYIDISLGNIGKTIKTKKIKIESQQKNRYLHMLDLYMYEWQSITSSPKWVGVRNFNDSDNTLISFTDNGTLGSDLIDDDLNSDDYTVGSTRAADNSIVYYPNGFTDDDVVPRKIIFGNVQGGEKLYNIFWNNYKTIDFINNNINNDDTINIKIGEVDSGNLYLDLYTLGSYNYDLKILEFDREDYKNEFTLLPLNTSIGEDLTDFVGYIQESPTGELSLSKYKTGEEYIFNFKNKDYGIYISNKDTENLSYRLSGEVATADINATGSGIYINPIDDSLEGVVRIMSNHMIIGGEKNFIGENFIVEDAK